MPKQLVLWSGGADSTLVLHDLLKVEGNHVRAMTVIHPQLPAMHPQREARTLLKKKLPPFEHFELRIDIDRLGAGAGVSQAFLWLTMAAQVVEFDETFVTGHVRGDDFWHRRIEAVAAFHALAHLRHLQPDGLRGSPTWEFPLEWVTKSEVLERLPAELLDLTWSCEGFKTRPCGTCLPCTTRKVALYEKQLRTEDTALRVTALADAVKEVCGGEVDAAKLTAVADEIRKTSTDLVPT